MGASSIFGNITEPAARWTPEPSTRGTFGLISSCVITLSLCVWSCVHLNVPDHKGERKQIWRKIGWVIVGSLVPEMVVFTAWYQRHEAKKLLYFMMDQCGQDHPELFFSRLSRWLSRTTRRKKAIASAEEPTSENSHDMRSTHFASKTTWTLTHAFYAAMGGFAIDGSTAETPFLPQGRDHLTITKAGIKIFFKLGYIDEFSAVSLESIRDKGKSGYIAKFLIALQALWFCTQLVARLAQSLPISLLELNTFAHGICAICAIYFWWEKPQDIEQPTLLPMNRIQPLCALLWIHSKVSKGRYYYTGGVRRWYKGANPVDPVEAQMWTSIPNTGSDDVLRQPKKTQHRKTYASLVCEVVSDSSNALGSLNSTIGPYASETPMLKAPTVVRSNSEPSSPSPRPSDSGTPSKVPNEPRGSSPSPNGVRVTRGSLVPNTVFYLRNSTDVPKWVIADPIRMARLSLASKVADLHPDFFFEANWPGSLNKTNGSYLAPRAAEFTSNTYIAGVPVILMTAMVYGGLYCLAWNSNSFASDTERLLWRISCLFLVIPVPLGILGYVALVVLALLWQGVEDLLPSLVACVKKFFTGGGLLIGILYGLGLVAFHTFFWSSLLALFLALVFGRFYLLIECFINVGHLESRVFLLPSWTNYLPHIS